VRLLIKDILVGEDTITIRHSIPIPSGAPKNGGLESPDSQNYLLCKGRAHLALRNALFARCDQHQLQQTHYLIVIDPARNFSKQQMILTVSKYARKSRSMIRVFHLTIAVATRCTASCAVRLGR
jgi:hypothetical protein